MIGQEEAFERAWPLAPADFMEGFESEILWRMEANPDTQRIAERMALRYPTFPEGFWDWYVKRTVRKWNRYYVEHALFRQGPGRPKAMDAAGMGVLQALLRAQPQDCGYPEGSWTVHLLLDALRRADNIEVSDSTLRRILHAMGYTWEGKRYVRDPARITTPPPQDGSCPFARALASVQQADVQTTIAWVNRTPPFTIPTTRRREEELAEQLQALERKQARMKVINRIIQTKEPELLEGLDLSEEEIAELDSFRKQGIHVGYPFRVFAEIAAAIRDVKKQIDTLSNTDREKD
jgi:transposase